MNMNEHMNQLGQIGSVGYAPTDSEIDSLLSRTKRARAVRQSSAAVVGSVSAIALGVVGAQVYVTIDHRNDASTQDRNLIENGLPGIFDFDAQYGGGYTGMDQKSKEAFDKIYEDLNLAAQIDAKHLAEKEAAAAAAAAAAAKDVPATCTYEEHDWNGGVKYRSPETNCQWVYPDVPTTEVPAGWIEFAGILGQCKTYSDVATGTTVFAAHIDAGDWRKLVRCDDAGGGNYTAGSYRYIYKYGDTRGTLSGTTCTGTVREVDGAPHQYSCNPKKSEWILTDSVNYKWFDPECRYYNIATPPAGWEWTGTSWAEVVPDPDPTPTPTPTPSEPTL